MSVAPFATSRRPQIRQIRCQFALLSGTQLLEAKGETPLAALSDYRKMVLNFAILPRHLTFLHLVAAAANYVK